MNGKPYSRAQLARDLGLSKASITKLAKRGMPTGSRAAAEEWRRRNVAPTWPKAGPVVAATTIAGHNGVARVPAYVSERICPGWTPKMVRGAHEQLCQYARYAALDFDAWKGPVRLAMAALPSYEWHKVDCLTVRQWRLLIGEREIAYMRRTADPIRVRTAEPGDDFHDFESEHFWYLLACGLMRVEVPADFVPSPEELAA